MTKVLVIGGGKIGSRHLQGILLSENNLEITVVDPSVESLNLCRIRANEIIFKNHNNILYRNQIPKKERFEICIISTNADIRAKVTEEVLAHCFIKHIIFEKVLFQKEIDYYNISKLLKKKKVNAWVNCPYRAYSFFQEIKKTLDLDSIIEMNVKGSSWGMACNSIHVIDLFSYFVNSSELKSAKINLSNKLINTKRGNKFKEVSGQMIFKINNHLLSIICDENKEKSFSIDIYNKKIKHSVDFEKKKWESNMNGLLKIQNCNIEDVSETSKIIVNNLIKNDHCGLISYEESCKLHLILLDKLRMHFSKILKREIIECTIT